MADNEPGNERAADASAGQIAGNAPAPGGLAALESLIAAGKGRGPAPVELWNPPYCGDIGMKIDAAGTWFYQGSPIGRLPLVKLFASVLWRDTNSRHYLVTPAEKVDVEVADAPFLAVEMEVEGSRRDQVIRFRTNVDDLIRCGSDQPMRFLVDPATQGVKPYVLVRGRLEALVTRAVYYDLIACACTEERHGREMFGIWSDGEFFEIAPASDLQTE